MAQQLRSNEVFFSCRYHCTLQTFEIHVCLPVNLKEFTTHTAEKHAIIKAIRRLSFPTVSKLSLLGQDVRASFKIDFLDNVLDDQVFAELNSEEINTIVLRMASEMDAEVTEAYVRNGNVQEAHACLLNEFAATESEACAISPEEIQTLLDDIDKSLDSNSGPPNNAAYSIEAMEPDCASRSVNKESDRLTEPPLIEYDPHIFGLMLEEMRALVPVYRQTIDAKHEKHLKRAGLFDIASDCFSEPFVRLGLVHELFKTVNSQNRFFFAMARKILEENAAIITPPLMQLSSKEFISAVRVVSDGCMSRFREPPPTRQNAYRLLYDLCMLEVCCTHYCEKLAGEWFKETARINVIHLAWRRKNAKLDKDVADALTFDNRLCSVPYGDPVFFNSISPEDMKTILAPADQDQLTNRKYVFPPM
ncbi:hypothetical protein TSAR_012922 [Trichomalopsis sarcophagae]|uniref:Uncharacterized protein n=1 Tax=Trichomalopsis sarcophagae TaxID=543379 RepID=A0A232EEG6_9HYME|nr:hypothetical protein TSAR_012922 [Trichomalopsis sarcophagae]